MIDVSAFLLHQQTVQMWRDNEAAESDFANESFSLFQSNAAMKGNRWNRGQRLQNTFPDHIRLSVTSRKPVRSSVPIGKVLKSHSKVATTTDAILATCSCLRASQCWCFYFAFEMFLSHFERKSITLGTSRMNLRSDLAWYETISQQLSISVNCAPETLGCLFSIHTQNFPPNAARKEVRYGQMDKYNHDATP